MKRYYLPVLLLLLCSVCACAPKTSVVTPSEKASAANFADLRDFPQTLAIFARQAGSDKLLMPPAVQAAKNARFDDIFFGPWHMRKSTAGRKDIAALFGSRARGYKNGSMPWTQDEWDAMKANANIGAFQPGASRPAITLRQTDLRELPTHEPRFSKPTPNPEADPFDYFQYSRLPVGTPLLIAHTSRDGRWHYVECPIAGGWVDAGDVALAGEDFRRFWKSGRYAALIKDNVVLPGTGPAGADSKAGIGTVLPAVTTMGSGLSVLVPVREKDGMAGTAETSLSASQAVMMPMPLTPGNVAAVGDEMMGQSYGWGGMFGLRDCSSMLRDLFTPFGIWLPRNSRSQARSGSIISLAGLAPAEKETTILHDGEPFISLVGMPGHITLYVGAWKNRVALFHNVWGLRIIKNGNDDERFVIGKAVVTSITPGMELENLYRPMTFGDRIKTLTTFRRQ